MRQCMWSGEHSAQHKGSRQAGWLLLVHTNILQYETPCKDDISDSSIAWFYYFWGVWVFFLGGVCFVFLRNGGCCSVAKLCLILYIPMDCSMPGFPVLHYLLEFAQTNVHWVSEATQRFHPLLTPSPPALSLSQHQVFSSELALCIRWPKYWNFSISPSNEYSGLISFRINWFDLLDVQGTLKSLLQHHLGSFLCIFPFGSFILSCFFKAFSFGQDQL